MGCKDAREVRLDARIRCRRLDLFTTTDSSRGDWLDLIAAANINPTNGETCHQHAVNTSAALQLGSPSSGLCRELTGPPGNRPEAGNPSGVVNSAPLNLCLYRFTFGEI